MNSFISMGHSFKYKVVNSFGGCDSESNKPTLFCRNRVLHCRSDEPNTLSFAEIWTKRLNWSAEPSWRLLFATDQKLNEANSGSARGQSGYQKPSCKVLEALSPSNEQLSLPSCARHTRSLQRHLIPRHYHTQALACSINSP